MAIGDHLKRLYRTIHPRSPQADDNPTRVLKMLMRCLKAGIDIFQQGFLSRLPEGRVVAEGAIIPLPRSDDFLVGKRPPVGHTVNGIGYADGVVQHPERIHHGIEAQATANPAHFIGEARTQEEQTITIKDGLLYWINTYFSLKLHVWIASSFLLAMTQSVVG